MSVTHPSPGKVETLRARWVGQEGRLKAIAQAMLAGADWTARHARAAVTSLAPEPPFQDRIDSESVL